MTLLKLNSISKTYGNEEVLKTVNLTIREGEFHTFLGPSGCGKTTLLRIIAGFADPDQGQVIFEGKDISRLAAEKRNVGMVFQNYALFPFMNVYDNVAYGLKVQKLKGSEVRRKVKKYLDIVHLTGYEKRKVSELSGGEQQRVALARTLVTNPKLLLLDEPLSNLDARLRDQMRQELKDIQAKLGITTIFVTHDQTEALTMSDTIAVFDKGTCVQVGTPEEIYNQPANSFVANFIGETNLFPVTLKDGRAYIKDNLGFQVTDLQSGQDLSIRPQDIKMCVKNPQKENVVRAMITERRMSGQFIEYVACVDQTCFRIISINDCQGRENFLVNQEVFLWLPARAIKILKRKSI